MKLYAPNYYPSFTCIADRCQHSCCIGWEIDIDADTLERYQTVDGAIGERLAANIEVSEAGACFRLDKDERCPFLNQCGLCDLITELGEDSLCEICAEHPRFRNFFDSREEIGLGLCCEEAARLILTHQPKVTLDLIADDRASVEESPEEDKFFAWRAHIIDILQDRTRSVNDRVLHLLDRLKIAPDRILNVNKWADFYQTLEQLDPAWGKRLEAWQSIDEASAQLPDTPEVAIALEQLAVYFVYRHLSGSLDDGRTDERIAFAMLSMQTIATLAALEIAARGSDPLTTLLEIARSYSSEIEYSTENVDRLLDELGMCI